MIQTRLLNKLLIDQIDLLFEIDIVKTDVFFNSQIL